MKKILLIFLILSALAIGKEVENVNISVSPNVKLSQNELNKDKEELKEIGYKFSEFSNKFLLLIVDHYYKNGKDMEKKVLNNIDKNIDFDFLIDYSNYILKQWDIHSGFPKFNVESIEIITNDIATIKISNSIPIIDTKINVDFYQNTFNILNQELEKDVSLSNKNFKKNIDEYVKRFLKIKPKNYNRIGNNEIELHKINGNWEIFEVDGIRYNFSLTNFLEFVSKSKDMKELFSNIDNLEQMSKELGISFLPPEILEGIVVYKNNQKFSISKNEIKDILGELKTKFFLYKPYKIVGLNKDTLNLYIISTEQDNNKKKEIQVGYFMYKKENGKWKRQTK